MLTLYCEKCSIAELTVEKLDISQLNQQGWYCTSVVINHELKTKTFTFICPRCAPK